MGGGFVGGSVAGDGGGWNNFCGGDGGDFGRFAGEIGEVGAGLMEQLILGVFGLGIVFIWGLIGISGEGKKINFGRGKRSIKLSSPYRSLSSGDLRERIVALGLRIERRRGEDIILEGDINENSLEEDRILD